MKRVLLLVAMLSMTVPAIAEQAEVRSALRVQQHNGLAQQYMERPTEVIVRGKPGKQDLLVRFTPYGGATSAFGGPSVTFRTGNADEYLAHISKFLDWAKRATEAGDEFTKEIGRARSTPGLSLKFEFHSGNAATHFLVVTLCSLGNCSVNESMYFDTDGANELSKLISRLKAGELPGEDVAAKYN